MYYDVDCESSDQQNGTLQSSRDGRRTGSTAYAMPTIQRVPMSTYNPKSRLYTWKMRKTENKTNTLYE